MESGYEEGNQGTADGRQADGIPRWNTQTDPETQVERGFARKQVTQNGATGRSQDVAGTGDERGSWRVVAGPEAMGEAMQVGSATGRRQFVVH
jgi:hypothetical protein